MKALTALAIAAALSFSGAAFADVDLAKKNACIGCHDATAKKLGPTWTAIAAKHKGDKGAEAKLAEAIVKGSKGVFGKIPMPPQPKAAGDAAALAAWIMTH
ncbi:MAG: c-type cytochrome [Pseudomonadota bacterium]|nr:c-type cytochrome [Pseudomonadota bacterium]MDP1904148.1 c-type cytochrome [Pseudomonadota bacterium]MDP2353775.1 c-type cytochrome [Pseudomonadota bacterium]